MDKKQASQKLDEIVGRAIKDEEYRQRLIENPDAALKEEGLTQEELNQVTGGAISFTHQGFEHVASVYQQHGTLNHSDLHSLLTGPNFGDLWGKVNKPR